MTNNKSKRYQITKNRQTRQQIVRLCVKVSALTIARLKFRFLYLWCVVLLKKALMSLHDQSVIFPLIVVRLKMRRLTNSLVSVMAPLESYAGASVVCDLQTCFWYNLWSTLYFVINHKGGGAKHRADKQ